MPRINMRSPEAGRPEGVNRMLKQWFVRSPEAGRPEGVNRMLKQWFVRSPEADPALSCLSPVPGQGVSS